MPNTRLHLMQAYRRFYLSEGFIYRPPQESRYPLGRRGIIDVREGGLAIKAVLFDADGVVQKSPPDWLARLESLSGDSSRSKEFLSDIFAAERPCLIGQGSFVDALARVLKAWNSSVPLREALRIWEMIEPDLEVLALVSDLRSGGIRVGLATNQQAERARFMTHDLGYKRHFDDLFYSFELGFAKPSGQYFSSVCDHLRMPPGQVLLIDDSESNVSAARRTGMEAYLYTLQSGPSETRRLLLRWGLPA